MIHPPEEVLIERALGTLSLPEASAVDAHLAACEACRGACLELADALGAWALSIPAVEPSPELKARLLASARDEHVAELAQVFHFDADAARRVLAESEDEARWVEGPVPSTKLFHLEGGAPTAGADCGLVRMARGTTFPEHLHVGEERVLVLQGTLHDSDGRVYRPGQRSDRLAGTKHHYSAGPETDLVLAVVLWGGIRILGA